MILNQILSTILKRNLCRSVWRICILIWGLKGLKGICHEDMAILGQFCAEIMTFVAFTYTQNVPVEL